MELKIQEPIEAITLMQQNPAMHFFGNILANLPSYNVKFVKTMAVGFNKNGTLSLFWNEDYFLKLTEPQKFAVLVHESLHIFYRHLDRFDFSKDDFKIKNIACDMAINQLIDNLPENTIDYRNYKGKYLQANLSADEYYLILIRDGLPDETAQLADSHDYWDSAVDENTGQKIEREVSQTAEVEQNVRKAADESLKKFGDLPKFVEASLSEGLRNEKKFAWKIVLRKFVTSVISMETRHTVKKTNKKLHHMPYVSAGKIQNKKPKILIIRDTSASCFSDRVQEEFAKECESISRLADVFIADCDTNIKKIDKVKVGFKFNKYVGGGGTSFVEAFSVAKKMEIDGIIYFTDLDGEFPEIPTLGKFLKNTIWVTFYRSGSEKFAPFGTTINIDRNLF